MAFPLHRVIFGAGKDRVNQLERYNLVNHGNYHWHHHESEDELFLVVKGSFRMEFRDHSVTLHEGEFLIVPRGVEHCPVADDEVCVLLFEPSGTLNTGNVRSERTIEQLERL